ncbi:MAG: Flp pilus assembly protein CpaB [Alphaproteobacteria bacterium]|nr:Flp pilus assembly protein CpaB [Alphaproteobacteria bacterium]
MISSRTLIILCASSVALLSAFALNSLSSVSSDPMLPNEPQKIAVSRFLVAARDLKIGSVLSESDLQWQEWPSSIDIISPHFISEEFMPDAVQEYVGGLVRLPLIHGEPITDHKIFLSDLRGGVLSALLKKGMLAVSVEISAGTGAGGFILPEDRVDLFQSLRVPLPGGENSVIVKTLLKNIRVLAVNQVFQKDDEVSFLLGKTVTLEVDPRQAELVIGAKEEGVLSLALRALVSSEMKSVSRSHDNSVLKVFRFGKSERLILSY